MSETAQTEATPAAPAAPAEPAPPSSLLSDVKPTAPAPAPGDRATETTPAAPVAPPIPETYEFKAPEGIDVKPEEVAAYSTLAKEIGLSQDQFAKLSDFHLSKLRDVLDAPGRAYNELQDGWRREVMADPALGGADGALNADAAQHAALALDRFGGQSLKDALIATGAGNHPAVVRAFVEMGRSLGLAAKLDLGKPAPASRQGNGYNEIAARLYPAKQEA